MAAGVLSYGRKKHNSPLAAFCQVRWQSRAPGSAGHCSCLEAWLVWVFPLKGQEPITAGRSQSTQEGTGVGHWVPLLPSWSRFLSRWGQCSQHSELQQGVGSAHRLLWPIPMGLGLDLCCES